MNDQARGGGDPASLQPNDSTNHPPLNFSPRFWGLVLLTGVGAGIGAGLLMKLLRAVQHFFYSYRAGNFLAAVEQATPSRRVVVVFSAGVIATLGVWILRRSRGGQAGRLNESIWLRSGRMASGKTIAQALLSIVIVGMGASLGREGAPKETGGAIASKLSAWAGLSPAETRLLVACGAGAGMAAVYNVPLGGALFALEVLVGTIALPLVPPALATSFIATAVAWLMLPNSPTYTIPTYAITPTQLIWSIAFGPIAGVASVFFVRLIILADGLKPKRGIMLAMPILVFAALGLVSILYPQLLGNGKDVTQLGLVGQISFPLLFALIFLKPLATAACLGSGAPGGLFTPTVTFGTVLGGFFGHVWSWLCPGATPGSYAVIGAAAVLAAAMQAPLAAIVLVLELTHHVMTIMVPILFAVTGATVTSRLMDRRSVYSGRIHVARQVADAPLADVHIPYHHLVSKAIATISIAANYTEVLERLLVTANHPRPLYVVDERGSLVGRIRLASVLHPAALPPVLLIAAAADLMEPVQSLTPSLDERDVLVRLNAEPAGELPVTDGPNGQILGIAIRP